MVKFADINLIKFFLDNFKSKYQGKNEWDIIMILQYSIFLNAILKKKTGDDR